MADSEDNLSWQKLLGGAAELELGTTYGGDPSRMVGGEIFVNPEQNCELAAPISCEGDDEYCRASIRVTGPGLCAYRLTLESDPGGKVGSCWERIFAATPDQYREYKQQWADKDGGRYVQGVQAEAQERCYP